LQSGDGRGVGSQFRVAGQVVFGADGLPGMAAVLQVKAHEFTKRRGTGRPGGRKPVVQRAGSPAAQGILVAVAQGVYFLRHRQRIHAFRARRGHA